MSAIPQMSRQHADPASTREAALTLLLRQGEATAGDLADHLAVSVQVMRRHLRSLEDDGLVEASPAQEGPGRPSNRWRLTTKGQGHFPDGSDNFALGLLQSMAGSLPAETLQKLLEQQALQQAGIYRGRIGEGPLPQRLERLVELRRQEGYVAECNRDPEHDQAWVISEFHCSVMRIAEQFPCVCDQELQLIRHTFPDCRVDRVHWRLEKGHSCGFRLIPSHDNAAVIIEP
jgi:DeoR family suf operon transcriptional repressor